MKSIISKAILTFLIFESLSCNRLKIPEGFDPFGKLTFVEDLSGKDGLGAGSFGEVIILDPISKEKIRLTYDEFYDIRPSWGPKGKSIIFESRRMKSGKLLGLSQDSHAYIFDFETLKIDQFDKNFATKFPTIIGLDNMCPAFSPDGNCVAFFTYENHQDIISPYYSLVVYSLKQDTLELIKKEVKHPKNLKWSPDGNVLCYTEDLQPELTAFSTAVTMTNRFTRQIIKSIGLDKWYYEVGDFCGERLIYCRTPEQDKLFTDICSLDLKTLQSQLVFTVEGYLLSGFAAADSSSLYAVAFDRGDKSDIFRIDLNSKSLTRITSDGHMKDGLDFLQKKD